MYIINSYAYIIKISTCNVNIYNNNIVSNKNIDK
jgi:hypothetical protein